MILCENLVKIYKVADLEVVALQGLDLDVAAAEMVSVIGASGSGKTTLMNILGGLDRPSAGQVWVAGKDLLKMADSTLDQYRRTQVGFIWQQGARNLIPYLTTLENVELPLALAGHAGPRDHARAEELLDFVGLAEKRHNRLVELSGGEQQRVAIAVALVNRPKLLLADEPTGEVDSATANSIFQILKNLNREFGLTMLIVSHDPEIARHVDRVVAIRDGKLATETVRQSVANRISATSSADGLEPTDAASETERFEELTVLDSAGRLQVPKEYLERYHIQRRVRLEPTETGLLILPASQDARLSPAQAHSQPEIRKPETSLARRLLQHLARRKRGKAI